VRYRQPMPTMSDEKSYSVTARDAAGQLGVHVETVKRWARTGKVAARKNLAGVWLFDQEDLNHLPVHEVRGWD
jgi:predicted site-specific integrase-resolvase